MNNINYKRISLITIPVTIGIPFVIDITSYIYYYISIGLCIISISIFCNFPIFIKILHTRPVYYEDILIIDNRGNNKNYLQNIFLYVNGAATVLFIIISGNYLYRRISENMDLVESLGILGGITILYSKLQMYFGKSILSVLFYIKNKKPEVEIEVIEFNDRSSQMSDINVDTPWLWCWCTQTQKCMMCSSSRCRNGISPVQTSAQTSAQTSVLSLPNVPYTPRFNSSPPPRQLNSLKPIDCP